LKGGALQVGILLAYCFGMLAYIQFAGPAIVAHDGYYHIKVADLMRERGLVLDFPWLRYTVLDEAGYTDHHWLLHVLQLPFTSLTPDLVLAAKWSAVVIATAAFAVFSWLLLAWRIPLAPVWVFALFAASSPFLFRMSLARGQALALALQLVAFHLLITRRSLWLACLAAVFVLAYDGFAILLPLTGFAVLAYWVNERQLPWMIILAVAAGLLAGLLVHPYFPRNVQFLWAHIVPKLFTATYEVKVGGEWYPYNTWKWFTESFVAISAYLAALFFVRIEDLKRDRAQLFWLLTASFYLVLYLKSRRFAEYFPPVALLCLAFVLRERLQRWLELADWRRPVTQLTLVGIMAALVLAAAWNLKDVRRDIRHQPPVSAYAGAASYLVANSAPGETVFHADWDDFPRLFYHDVHNTYILGLDPDFMRLKYPKLFEDWLRASRGEHENLAAVVTEFKARLIFTDTGNKQLLKSLAGNSRFERVYHDAYAEIYRLRGISK